MVTQPRLGSEATKGVVEETSVRDGVTYDWSTEGKIAGKGYLVSPRITG